MHRPFDGFSCEFTSIANCFNLQFIVGIRKMRIPLYFMPSNYKFNEPLDVPAYAVGQGLVRCKNHTRLRFVCSALFLNLPLGVGLTF